MKIAAPAHADQPPSASPDWVDVLTDLRGLKLAVYDELLRHGECTPTQLAALLGSPEAPATLRREAQAEGGVERALAWLGHHRLAMRNNLTLAAGERWRPRTAGQARALFSESGPDAAYPLLAPAPASAAQEGRGDRRSQGQVTRAEGAGASPLSTPSAPSARVTRRPAPPAAPVHAPQFFDFGDY